MEANKVALVTGANKGIGKQIAKDLAGKGFTVLVGARKLDAGEKAAAEIGHGARAIELDVTKEATIAAAAKRIRDELGRLDVLVNNAGIASVVTEPMGLEESVRRSAPSVVKVDDIRTVFETNFFGVIAVTQAMLPLLREAPAGRIVNVSSGIGSLGRITEPGFPYKGIGGGAYGPSKTALNAITVAFAQELEGTRIKVNAVCPGYVATDLNGFSGPRTVEQGASHPVHLATLGDDGPTGTYSNEDGPLPW